MVCLGWNVSRLEGAILIVLYVAYVSLIWVVERHPPALGEVGELAEAQEHRNGSKRVGRDLAGYCCDVRRSDAPC